ncbi:MAG: nickel ABC transporter permease [Bacillota bacterium]
MFKYTVRRLLSLIPVLLGISFITFMLLHLTPGDPVSMMFGDNMPTADIERVREALGLNAPLWQQFLNFLTKAVRGDLGMSFNYNRPVAGLVFQRIGATIELSVVALVISYVIAVPVGIISAVKQNTWIDDLGMIGALIGVSMPDFWLGLMMILLFAVQLKWLPPFGSGTWKHLVMPSLALGMSGAALTARLMRASMLEVIRQDYIRTARAKGLGERVVIYRHALRNALIPVLTVLGTRLGFLVGGATIIETVFARPGVGRLMVDSINRRDYPVVQGVVLVLATSIVIANILVDISYTLVDPRIKFE